MGHKILFGTKFLGWKVGSNFLYQWDTLILPCRPTFFHLFSFGRSPILIKSWAFHQKLDMHDLNFLRSIEVLSVVSIKVLHVHLVYISSAFFTASDWLPCGHFEEIAELVFIIHLWGIPTFCCCQSPGHRPEVYWAVWCLMLEGLCPRDYISVSWICFPF